MSAYGPQQGLQAPAGSCLGCRSQTAWMACGDLAVHIVHRFDGALEGAAIAFVFGTLLRVIHLIERQQAGAEFLKHDGLQHGVRKGVGEKASDPGTDLLVNRVAGLEARQEHGPKVEGLLLPLHLVDGPDHVGNQLIKERGGLQIENAGGRVITRASAA